MLRPQVASITSTRANNLAIAQQKETRKYNPVFHPEGRE